jgi:pimeloyl-ACP methyl ester carboxylesterase
MTDGPMSEFPASDTPVELLCGLLCDDTIWAPVAKRLRATGTDVAIQSFAGFTSITAMAQAALDQAPPRFALAGHSMGARVALEICRLAPDRVARLALLNTGIHGMRPSEPESRGRLVDLARKQGMEAVAAEWLPPMMGAGLEDEALMARLRIMVIRQTPESFAGQIRALLDRPEAETVLGDVRVPVLLVAATRDRWSPVAQHEAMLALSPDARLAIVEDAGHMAPVEKPEPVAAELMTWLEDR